jgi:hypothetical protein
MIQTKRKRKKPKPKSKPKPKPKSKPKPKPKPNLKPKPKPKPNLKPKRTLVSRVSGVNELLVSRKLLFASLWHIKTSKPFADSSQFQSDRVGPQKREW